MKGTLDLRHRAIDIHEQAIWRSIRNGKTICLRKIYDGLIVRDSWAKLLSKLRHAQELMIVGTAGIVEPIQ